MSYLDVPDFADDLEAVEVGGHFGQVVEDGGDAEQGRGASEFLKRSTVVEMFRIFSPKNWIKTFPIAT
jgi:hypothetical protein